MFTYSYDALFSQKDCDEIIRLSRAEAQDTGGLVGGKQQGDIRRARISWLDDEGDAGWVLNRVMTAVAKANREAFDFDITEFREKLQVAIYDESEEGHYDWHSDVGEGPIQWKLHFCAQWTLAPAVNYSRIILNKDRFAIRRLCRERE